LSWVAYASFLGLIMHVPYALMLGTAGGILEFIPVVGPLVASVLIIGVALLNGYHYWLIVGIFSLSGDWFRTMQFHRGSWAQPWNCIRSRPYSAFSLEPKLPGSWAFISRSQSWRVFASCGGAGACMLRKNALAR